MTLRLLLQRLAHEWRQTAVILLSICLVTAFFALGPFYTRAATESGLRYELAKAPQSSRQLSFVSPVPIQPEAWDLVNRQLGPVNGGMVRVARTSTAIQGFDFLYGEPVTEFTPRSGIRYHVFAFSNLSSLFRVAEGRWPVRLPPPGSPERSISSPEEAIVKGVDNFSRGDVEAVLTTTVAQIMQMGVGSRFVVGELPENRVVINVVGLVEPLDPESPIWFGNRRALEGEPFEIAPKQTGYNMALIVNEGSYTDWIAHAARNRTADQNTFVWEITLKTDAINADNFEQLSRNLTMLTSKMANDTPGLSALTTLPSVLNRFTGQISTTRGPVLLLSGAILLLMLYHLVATVGLTLEQRQSEWASLASRGASGLQLVTQQSLSSAILCGIGFLFGPLLAALLLQALVRIGPMAASGATLPGIPDGAYTLSGIAAVAAFVALILPAIPAARRSLAEFKQIVSRPPSNPLWARYALDAVLIVIGVGFLARLFFFVSGDLGQAVALLVSNPRQLIQAVLDGANQTGGLSDPLNLAGPALLLTGLALLWLRLFPLLMRLIGIVMRQDNGLTGPLSVWNVERDPGHYAQLVLLLIGTLALGTAALALGATRDAGAWESARLNTGGSVRIDLGPTAPIESLTPDKLAGVVDASILTRTETEPGAGRIPVALVGVRPQEIAQRFPEAAAAASLIGQQPTTQGRQQQQLVIPVVMSERMAVEQGQTTREDKLPLNVGRIGRIELPLTGGKLILNYRIVGITRSFPTLTEDQYFLIVDTALLARVVNAVVPADKAIGPTQIWLNLRDRQPAPELLTLGQQPGLSVTAAWDHYNDLLREPLPAAIAGILYAGFWVSLLLALLDFGYYLAVTARRRSLGFAVLQALGWNTGDVWVLLLAEQSALAIPALLIGLAFGAVLAYLILPFLGLTGGAALVLPPLPLVGLLLALLTGFGLLLVLAAWWLRRLNINQVLRLGEE